MSEIIRTGGCLCGAVQLTITGEPAVMTYCHCESCRRWLGAPVHAGCLFPAKNVQIEKGGELLTTFRLTEESGSHRKFCMKCGSPVLNDHPGIGMTDIPAVSIPDLAFEPELHSHYPEKILSIRDGLPKYKDFDPAVGGSDEVVPE
jgi:hypothetical protein